MAKDRWYPFVMLGCAMAVNFIYLGMLSNVMGLYTPSILQEFPEFSRSSFTVAVTLLNLMAAVGNLLHTPVRERISVRGMLFVGLGLLIAGVAIYSAAESLPVFYLGGSLMGLACGFCGSGTATLMVNGWFARRSGLFVSLAMAGTGLGVAVFSPIVSHLIEGLGWRPAFLTIGAAAAVLGLILAVVYRSSPEAAGLSGRWGETGRPETVPAETHKKVAVLKNPAYCAFLVLGYLMGIVLYAVMTNLSVIATDMGYSIIEIGYFSSVIFLVNIASQLPIGMCCDRFGSRKILYAAFGVTAAVYLAFLALPRIPMTLMFLIAAVFGCGKTVLNNVTVFMVQEIAPEEDKPHMISLGVAVMSLGAASGIYFVQFGYDLSGSYAVVYVSLIMLAAVCFGLSAYLNGVRSRMEEERLRKYGKNKGLV